jgi:hypothetical protein
MQNLGIRLLVLSYCCMGCVLGQLVQWLPGGRPAEHLHEGLELLPFSLLANVLGISGLVMFFRRGLGEAGIDRWTEPFEVLLRGGAANNRIAFFLCATSWVVGVLLGEFLSK